MNEGVQGGIAETLTFTMYLLYFGEHLHPIYTFNTTLIPSQLQRKIKKKV